MKTIKILISLVLLFVLGCGIYGYISYQTILKEEAPQSTLTFNETEINYQSAKLEYPLFNGLIPITREFINDSKYTLETQMIVNSIQLELDDLITVTQADGISETYTNVDHLYFEKNGLYQVQIQRVKDSSTFLFEFNVNVNHKPSISISNQNPSQGELLIVEIDNLEPNSTIEIKNHFRPSAILQKDYKARFYLPMAYRESAKVYPLSMTINGQTYDYELDVKTYEFKELHFTVSASVSNSTVGNNDAVIQYRETIYPLYETFETEEYWDGNFINPVEGARVSSTFGEMRFVNNAKTPTRHAGIDYAIQCGTEVLASNAGKVEYAGFLTMIGNTIVIDHGLGLKTFYEHMEDISINQGDRVEKGQLIGHVGTTGYSTGCHLHFQAMVKNQSFNPEFLYSIAD